MSDKLLAGKKGKLLKMYGGGELSRDAKARFPQLHSELQEAADLIHAVVAVLGRATAEAVREGQLATVLEVCAFLEEALSNPRADSEIENAIRLSFPCLEEIAINSTGREAADKMPVRLKRVVLGEAAVSLSIEYRLVGSGWAECRIVTTGGEYTVITASYLSDALGNLILAAVGVLVGFTRLSFGFDEEPGEYRWVIRTTGDNDLVVEVLSFDESWSNKPDSEGKPLLRIECSRLQFARAVAQAANSSITAEAEACGTRGRPEKRRCLAIAMLLRFAPS